MTTTAYTAEALKAMSKAMYDAYENGNDDAEKVAKALSKARKAAMALESGNTLGSFEGAAKREIEAAVAMYKAFKADE